MISTSKVQQLGFNRRTFLVGAMGLAIATCIAALPTRADINLTFGTYAADKPTEVVRQFKPFLTVLGQDMSEILGEPVTIKMQIAREYQAGIDDLVNGQVDFSRFGPASYVTAKSANSDVELVVMESKNGKKTFKGLIVVHKDSEISSLQDLSDQSFAFGDRLSTIGRYLSQSMLLNAGVSSRNLSGFEFLGRHDRVGSAVGKGDFTAGALKSSTYKKLVAKGVPIKVLADFDNVTKPWIARPGLEPRVLQAMQTAMLAMQNEQALNAIAKSGFLVGHDTDYDPIRSAMDHSTDF